MSKDIRWVWECKTCEDKVISYSEQRHTMNTCKCGKSSVDLEVGYARAMGDVEVLNIEEYTDKGWIEITYTK